jgi:hypothetical protein
MFFAGRQLLMALEDPAAAAADGLNGGYLIHSSKV